ncbi:VanZ family protein [Allostreptomyces psammosilenae]|uniref:Glycopeptide antibiotics resistance protein n=1 Tax=Allostreptomyces psammosilenae TaxID=1892865 RepID=A0A853A060_9ACTN|nr:VanZ family protein [Allostreptomyces psammosilenae]NYI08013.1 glycopeptide antibiotics resistance protein [Allostreptomyces psammosilenae]
MQPHVPAASGDVATRDVPTASPYGPTERPDGAPVPPPGPGRSHGARLRRWAVLLLVADLVVLFVAHLRPLTVPWVPDANFEPLATLLPVGDSWRTVFRWGSEWLWFAPLGALQPLVRGVRPGARWSAGAVRVLGWSLVASVCLELAQSQVTGRTFNVDDIVLALLAALLGYLAATPLLRRLAR